MSQILDVYLSTTNYSERLQPLITEIKIKQYGGKL